MDAQAVKEYARDRGADLVGIAAVERFDGLPPERHPASIFPECRSVVVLGRRILRGAMRGVEEGTNFGSTYGMFGYRWLEDNFLSRTVYDLTCWLETQGAEAVPLFGYDPDGMPKGVPVAPDKPAPNVLIDIPAAAQAAGLAEIGLGDFLITPEYGTRQRFAVVLTDAELESDAPRPKSICADCGACAEACPHGAIDLETRRRAGAPGLEAEVATVDDEICRNCRNGAFNAPGHGSRPDRIAAACGRACLVQLEKAGKCANRFQQDFRKREPWAVDFLANPVGAGKATPVLLGCDKGTTADRP